MIFPFAVSSYSNDLYGLSIVLAFTTIVTIGFIYELGKNALKIESRQSLILDKLNKIKIITL
uniref:NADH dehydrogenase subunit 3 n=1 Tax=Raffaelea arxii TaxID=45342 RepID=UPI00292A41EA|nr:NADH dehydrogenase subunit 3 [Raffaelea arxii]WNK75975.1 NADH dehydrogenase subunit 3 [Raffaelea arxii]